jgi:hypothetical protein
MFSTVKSFVGHVMPSIIRPIHILWNQVIGFLFIVLALYGISSAVRSYQKGSGVGLAVAIAWVVPMAGFGIASFWKARKISKS